MFRLDNWRVRPSDGDKLRQEVVKGRRCFPRSMEEHRCLGPNRRTFREGLPPMIKSKFRKWPPFLLRRMMITWEAR